MRKKGWPRRKSAELPRRQQQQQRDLCIRPSYKNSVSIFSAGRPRLFVVLHGSGNRGARGSGNTTVRVNAVVGEVWFDGFLLLGK